MAKKVTCWTCERGAEHDPKGCAEGYGLRREPRERKPAPKSQHPPGPWKVLRRVADDPAALPREGESGIIYQYVVMDEYGKEVMWTFDKEHARLIAAAPGLLRLLKENLVELRRTIEEIGGCDHPVNICCCGLVRLADDTDEAITKAEGVCK